MRDHQVLEVGREELRAIAKLAGVHEVHIPCWQNPAMARQKMTPFLEFGDLRPYEGDNPWWTLRFVGVVNPAQRSKLQRLLRGTPFHVSQWESERQVQLEADVALESADDWRDFRADVAELLARIHAAMPLFAVFLQEGQFFDGASIKHLGDDELRALPAPAPASRAPAAKGPAAAVVERSPIGSLSAVDRTVTVEGVVEALGKRRTVRRRDQSVYVREGVLRDESGAIGVTFWGDDAAEIEDGMRIRIENGWVGAHYNTQAPNLSRGKGGRLVHL